MSHKVQLPTTTADKLLHHLSVCPECRASVRKCHTARELIQATLKERHG